MLSLSLNPLKVENLKKVAGLNANLKKKKKNVEDAKTKTREFVIIQSHLTIMQGGLKKTNQYISTSLDH